MENNNVPVRVGEEIDVVIEAVGEKGDGIARKKGFVLFVPGTKEGDEVKIKVTKIIKKVGFAEVLGPAEKKNISHKEATEAAEEIMQDIEEDSYEDTEDFGEDLDQ